MHVCWKQRVQSVTETVAHVTFSKTNMLLRDSEHGYICMLPTCFSWIRASSVFGSSFQTSTCSGHRCQISASEACSLADIILFQEQPTKVKRLAVEWGLGTRLNTLCVSWNETTNNGPGMRLATINSSNYNFLLLQLFTI